MTFFSEMQPLNKTALFLFLLAKIFGLIGVSLGFIDHTYHEIGGYFLIIAFISIFASVVCGLFQASLDKKKFSKEDEEKKKIRAYDLMRTELLAEIKSLEERRNALRNFSIKKERMS